MIRFILHLFADFFASDCNNWTNDDIDFVNAFYSTVPMPSSRNAQKFYHYGPIFFTKQFNKDSHKEAQKKCRKNWMFFLDDVANARMLNNINW